jgi:hypothetical protein
VWNIILAILRAKKLHCRNINKTKYVSIWLVSYTVIGFILAID